MAKTNALGVKALKTFLSYAKTRSLNTAEPTGREHDSEFEREVATAIAAHRYEVHPQVGEAGFFVDLAIVDPDSPGRYLLGVECDGASYHSSRSACDRDRLRQEILEGCGWIIHRISSTDWFHRPDEQLRKVLTAIQDAESGSGNRPPAAVGVSLEMDSSNEQKQIERDDGQTSDLNPDCSIDATPYEEADFSVDAHCDIHEMPLNELGNVVAKIVQAEGPVHQDEIARRVATLWGLRRTGNRITDAVEKALDEADHRGMIARSGLFFQPASQDQVPIRNRERVKSTNLRKPEFLPPSEVRAALVSVVGAHIGISTEETTTEVARLFGFKSTSAQIRQLIEDEIRLATEEEQLDVRNGKLYGLKESTIERESHALRDSPQSY